MKERDRQEEARELREQWKLSLFFANSEKHKVFFPSEYEEHNEEESEDIEDSELEDIDKLLRTLNKKGVLTAQDLEEGWI